LFADGLGSTVGAGIFVIYGVVASTTAGPAIVFSFLFAAIASFLSALCYSEFAARIPLSGSAYTFAYMSMGEFLAWFIGWNLTLEYGVSAAAVARGCVRCDVVLDV
jgi:APA family basic amino acid/polyamine antiporter